MREQIFTANLLASKFGHWWAFFDVPVPETWADVKASLDRRIEEERDSGVHMGGIESRPGQDGVLRHATGTGRLLWDVHPGGETSITLTRPELGTIVRAEIFRSDRSRWMAQVWSCRTDRESDPLFECRHFWAMHDVAVALADDSRLGLDGFAMMIGDLLLLLAPSERAFLADWVESVDRGPYDSIEDVTWSLIRAAAGRAET